MPANLVKPGQEDEWRRAKTLAEEQGRGGDYAYIVGIFNRLVGEKVDDPRGALGKSVRRAKALLQAVGALGGYATRRDLRVSQEEIDVLVKSGHLGEVLYGGGPHRAESRYTLTQFGRWATEPGVYPRLILAKAEEGCDPLGGDSITPKAQVSGIIHHSMSEKLTSPRLTLEKAWNAKEAAERFEGMHRSREKAIAALRAKPGKDLKRTNAVLRELGDKGKPLGNAPQAAAKAPGAWEMGPRGGRRRRLPGGAWEYEGHAHGAGGKAKTRPPAPKRKPPPKPTATQAKASPAELAILREIAARGGEARQGDLQAMGRAEARGQVQLMHRMAESGLLTVITQGVLGMLGGQTKYGMTPAGKAALAGTPSGAAGGRKHKKRAPTPPTKPKRESSTNGQPQLTLDLGGERDRAPAKAPTAPKAGKGGKIERSGDHIYGSRKDLSELAKEIRAGRRELTAADLDEMSFDEGTKIIRKALLVPAHDLDTLKGMGMTPGGAVLYQGLLGAIQAKPPGDTAAERLRYAEDIRGLLGAAKAVKTVKDVRELMGEVYEASIRPAHSVVETMPIERYGESHKRAWELGRSTGKKHVAVKTFGVGGGMVEIRAYEPAPYSAMGKRFDAYVRHRGKSFKDQRRRADAADRLGEDGWEYLEADTSKKKADQKAKASKRNTERGWSGAQEIAGEVIREGGTHVADGADPDRVREMFGLREVDYGQTSYMTQADREYHTMALEEALFDFSEVLGIPTEQVSFQGRLGVALGARGRGRARAHYEAGRYVINITKFQGGGTLAHEWGHALDNIVRVAHGTENKAGGKAGLYATHTTKGLPPAVAAVIQDVQKTIMEATPEEIEERVVAIEGLRERTDNAVVEANRMHGRIYELKQKKLLTDKAEHVARQEAHVASWEGYLADPSTRPTYIDEGSVNSSMLAARGRLARSQKDSSYRTAEEDAELSLLVDEHHDAVKRAEKLRQYLKLARGMKKVTKYAFAGAILGEEYWGNPQELFARAFESFVEDSLRSKDRRSTYLVDGTTVPYATGKDPLGVQVQPYPTGPERDRINAAMERMLQVIRETGTMEKGIRAMAAGGGRLALVVKAERKLHVGARGGTWADAGHTTPFYAGPDTALPGVGHLTDGQVEAGIAEKARDVARCQKSGNDRMAASHKRLHDHLVVEKARRVRKAEQAQLFVGPRGGKYADPKHTRPWREPSGHRKPSVLGQSRAIPDSKPIDGTGVTEASPGVYTVNGSGGRYLMAQRKGSWVVTDWPRGQRMDGNLKGGPFKTPEAAAVAVVAFHNARSRGAAAHADYQEAGGDYWRRLGQRKPQSGVSTGKPFTLMGKSVRLILKAVGGAAPQRQHRPPAWTRYPGAAALLARRHLEVKQGDPTYADKESLKMFGAMPTPKLMVSEGRYDSPEDVVAGLGMQRGEESAAAAVVSRFTTSAPTVLALRKMLYSWQRESPLPPIEKAELIRRAIRYYNANRGVKGSLVPR